MPSPKLRRRAATKHSGNSRVGRSAVSNRSVPPVITPAGRLPAHADRSADRWQTVTRSAAETERLGRVTGQALRGGEMLALYGEMGSGKTVFVRGLAVGLGAPARAVSSPTFVLVHEYPGRLLLIHADLYRLEQEADLRHLGLSDYQDGSAVLAIEWADKAGAELPQDRLEIRLEHKTATSRSIVMQATGPVARACLARLAARSRTARKPPTAGLKEHSL
ncbi:MAG: tRNA (adenosine(37)-N6)-threonylcarbamoyltransferase complex ATPase subunit type 1 TsaE [Nitrospirota bacterium]|nr:tRNA (adenosine(37)-N6)-threonylcarbamoyltransferase complex ATPase subunit type 1 TsaE [Nitrospirota bacterium]